MNKNKIVFTEQDFTKYEIPQYIEKQNKSKGYVQYGDDNQFPSYLITLLAKSPRHANIVKKKAMLVGGRGFITTNLEMDTMLFLKNSKNEYDLDEILAKVSYDFEVFGGFCLNIVWSKDRTRISEINYIDVSKVRVANPDPEQGYPQIENYYISDGWENERKYPPVWYTGFSIIDRKEASQILYIKGHRAGTEFYAQPDYLPAIYWMELEMKIQEFHLSSVIKGFHPSFHINWPIGGNASDEEMDELVYKLKTKFSNATNAGETFITFIEDELKPTITPITANSSDERFINLDSLIEKGILHSHRVNDPQLFGVNGGGNELSSNGNDRVQAMMEFEIDYVIPQQQIIEKVFNNLGRINGLTDKLMINRYTDAYKKVGADSASEVLAIISNTTITPKQKYHLLICLNYTHDISSNLSAYEDAKQKDQKTPTPISPIKHSKFDMEDREDGDADVHPNCRCSIENNVFITEPDCCDECNDAADEYNS